MAIAAILFFLPFMAIEEKKKKDSKNRILRKEEEEEKPIPFIYPIATSLLSV